MRKIIYSALLFLFAINISFSQKEISGRVVEEGSNTPVVGASVLIVDLNTGTVTDEDGRFTLTLPTDEVKVLRITSVGFDPISVNSDGDLTSISLNDGILMNEIVVMGVVDVVKDRQTPVAVSTINSREIQLKSGNTEFPDLIKSTPSVYISNQAGGYGDSKMFTRGFDQSNTAFLLNGQPINGMEDGNMYWSNWSGMNDIATAIQVQRGLGSSKLAISSVGGTVNIITRATENKEGGWASLTAGNNNYYKGTIAYNTGLKNKIGLSVLLTHWQGDGWAEGTKGQGQNYFVSLGYKPNEKHSFNFLVTGAPQWHDQNFTKRIKEFDTKDIRFNGNWGTFKGEYLSERRNYYHKPVANVNWNWKLSQRSTLSTVLYASWGRGGGTGNLGQNVKDATGQINFDSLGRKNDARLDGSSAYIIRASVNNHQWYGLVSNFQTKLTENLAFNIGLDVRNYTGVHFRQITNLIDAEYFLDKKDVNTPNHKVSTIYKADPWSSIFDFADEGNRIDYDYSERITYGGAFAQLEYVQNKISAYVQGSVSTQSHVRTDRFNYLDGNQESDKITNPGYNIKGGVNFNVNDNNSIYVNAGYYSRQPYHDNLYLNFQNIVNDVAENENIIGLEAGYKFRSRIATANLNLYATQWNNRIETTVINPGDSLTLANGTKRGFPNGGFTNSSNLNQYHTGIELDGRVKLMSNLSLKAYASLGNWIYKDNAKKDVYDDDRSLVESVPALYVKDAKVGGSAQTTFGVGLDYSPVKNLGFDVTYNYYDELYAEIGPLDNTFKAENNKGTIQLPSFGLLDFGAHYTFNLKNAQALRLRLNIYNILDEQYISYASSNIQPSDNATLNYKNVNKDNFIQWGTTRTWNVTLRYSF